MVRNIVSIDSYSLQNSEFLGLMQKLSVFAETLSSNEILSSVAKFRSKVKVLEKVLEVELGEPVTRQAQHFNSERLVAYSALRHCVKGLTLSPNKRISEAGAKFWNVIEAVDDPRNQNQDAATHTLNALTCIFRKFDSAEMASFGVLMHLETIESSQEAFIGAAKLRGQKADSRVKNATRKSRKECYEAFRTLIFHAFARADNIGDTECQDFVEQCNGELSLRKSLLKTRKTLAAKSSEESEKAENNEVATNETAANDVVPNEVARREVATGEVTTGEATASVAIASEVATNDHLANEFATNETAPNEVAIEQICAKKAG